MILLDILATLSPAPLEAVYAGAFWTAVVVSRGGEQRCGLASTQAGNEGHRREGPAVRWAGHLLEHDALELAQLVLPRAGGQVGLEASIGMAAVNALLEVGESFLREENALHILAREGAGKRVALVGHFPFVPRLRPAVGRLDVLELHPGPEDLPAEEAAHILPLADVVAITGSALLNGTLEGLLAYCRPAAYVQVLGPSTPLSPVLLDYGVTDIAGSIVVDLPAALRGVMQGATFQQMEGVRTVVLGRS
jgi:uncharacterized protein (DUF4213/DUF364 family)